MRSGCAKQAVFHTLSIDPCSNNCVDCLSMLVLLLVQVAFLPASTSISDSLFILGRVIDGIFCLDMLFQVIFCHAHRIEHVSCHVMSISCRNTICCARMCLCAHVHLLRFPGTRLALNATARLAVPSPPTPLPHPCPSFPAP